MRRIGLALLLSAHAVGGVQAGQRGVGPGGQSTPAAPQAVFQCGVDQVLQNPIPERETTLVLAGDSRQYTPCPIREEKPHPDSHRETRERALLRAGLKSTDPDKRWRAAQGVSRLPRYSFFFGVVTGRSGNAFSTLGTSVDDPLGDLIRTPINDPACSALVSFTGQPTLNQRRWQPGILLQLLDDWNLDVRKEAAYAIGKRIAAPGRSADEHAELFKELKFCVARAQLESTPQSRANDEVQGLLLEAIGLAAYPNDSQRNEAEAFLVEQAKGSTERLLGAVRGLEALVRGKPSRPLGDAALARLRELAVSNQAAGQPIDDDPKSTIRMLAVQSLLASGAADADLLSRVAADGDWQVRRLIASRLDPGNPDQAGIVANFQRDQAFQVRWDLVSSITRFASRTASCAPLVPYLDDSAPVVVMRALDSLPAKCTDLDEVLPKVTKVAESLERATEEHGEASWHLPTRALTALSRLRPEAAKPLLQGAVKNQIWQVRVAAVGVASTLRENAVVEGLANDPVANVRTAALDALSRSKNPAVVPLAIAAIQDGRDYQLLMTAARVLRGLPAEAKENATVALLATLRRLTDEADDLSRDPRVAILDRLGETMAPERANDLLYYAADFDDAVCDAAVKSFTALVGSAPVIEAKRRRYPAQPTEAALNQPPSKAFIQLEGGVVEFDLLSDVAPVTVAQFARLARAGAYNGKTFHRIVTNFVVQGGSSGGNEYSGVNNRFLRDEVGPQARHRRGAVGISTRGADTGDGQMFIDLADSPRLDRAYTVFAYVKSGMELVDRMLDGAVIKSVTVR